MINRIDLQNIHGPQKIHNKHKQFQGITPEFFGPPNKIDRMKDMHLCKQMGINTNGMNRTDIKANILSGLTGQSVDQMKSLFSDYSEKANKHELETLKYAGMQPSSNPNYMQAMGENKAMIANLLMNNNQSRSGFRPDGPPPPGMHGPGQGPPQGLQGAGQDQQGPPPHMMQLFQTYGIQPTGDKASDMAALMEKVQEQSGNNQGSQQSNGSKPAIPTAVLSVMQAVGVSPSGSKDSDYSTVMNRIQSMIDGASNDSQKQRAQNLLSMAQNAFSSDS